MKPIINTLLVSILIILSSCSKDDNPTQDSNNQNNNRNKILPLGASRVEGDRPAYESYRYELWKLLVDNQKEFDFIGSKRDDSQYPDFNGLEFDRDHEGRGGITSGGIREGLTGWLMESGTPDIVLFSSPGGNDGIENFQQSINNINAIIDILQSTNSKVTILIELTAPPLTSEQTAEFLFYYNKALKEINNIAIQQTTATSRVIAVDMKTNFTDAFLADDVHYNEAGARFIANRYFEVLTNLLE